MKNRFFVIIYFFFIAPIVLAEEIFIQSKNITLNKESSVTVFKDEVSIKTKDNNTIKSDYAEYNKKIGSIKLKGNIKVIDFKNNIIQTNQAIYNEKSKIFKSIGSTKLITFENYIIEGSNIIFDNNNRIIKSNDKSVITDKDKNNIYLDSFEFQINKNIFKSIGYIKIEDINNNSYEFSQIYIDTKKKQILGTDIKALMNQKDFKIHPKNKPRILANTMQIGQSNSSFNKSIFTLCDYRKNDKCPPWTIQATEMLHDNKKKTIYYDNAVIKVYNIPIFYFPKISHPDPSVDRRSGFLPPTFYDTKNLGTGISIPYFFDIAKDKNLTLTSRLYAKENSLFLGEYQQAFKDSNFMANFGFTEGYKNTSSVKKAGDKSHFFSKFVKNFKNENDTQSTLSLTTQEVSNDKYLKLYKIKSDLIDYHTSTLENSLSFTTETDDLFLGLNASVYETLNDSYNDKYEYILPDITVDKSLFNNKFGNADLQTNFKVHNYDTNKLMSFVINDLNWNSNIMNFESGFRGEFLGNIKNINYEAKNLDIFKEETTNELFGALGYLNKIDLEKTLNNSRHLMTPKMLIRYAPGSMRKEISGLRLDPINAFSLNRLDNIDNFETGLSGTIGLDYKIVKKESNFDFSIAQIINEKENKKMHSITSLDEKLSDLVGSADLQVNEKINFNYKFALDQNYQDFNYNEFGTVLNFEPLAINFDYLKEDKHIGNQEYFKTQVDLSTSENNLFSIGTKRNLITNSSEFYNLSYEYINDCLRAGLVYRREFYNDSELEPEDSLMFKITLTPFGNIESPSFSK